MAATERPNEAGGFGTATDLVPRRPTCSSLQRAAQRCRACGLFQNAPQTVFEEGPATAEVMLIGEQPGDREDLVGRPFVGPAGRVLDEALAAAGIDRGRVYVTNVVKHFKWMRRGKRRIHKRPAAEEIAACRPWLDAEIRVVKPEVIVCLGATAAQSLLGKKFRVTRDRGVFVDSSLAPLVTATLHPSAILRMQSGEDRDREMAAFVHDLKRMAARLSGSGS